MKVNLLEVSLKTARDLGEMGCDKYRNAPYVYQKITEELSEINEELEKKIKGQECGKDGIMGESIDFLISVLDMAYLIDPKETAESLAKKLNIDDITNKVWHENFNLKEMKLELEKMFKGKDVSVDDFGVVSQKISTLLTQVGNLSIAVQMIEGTTYKKPEKYGFNNVNEFMISVLKDMTYQARIIFEVAYKEECKLQEMPEMNEKMTEIWINKTAKWRKSRGLPE